MKQTTKKDLLYSMRIPLYSLITCGKESVDFLLSPQMTAHPHGR